MVKSLYFVILFLTFSCSFCEFDTVWVYIFLSEFDMILLSQMMCLLVGIVLFFVITTFVIIINYLMHSILNYVYLFWYAGIVLNSESNVSKKHRIAITNLIKWSKQNSYVVLKTNLCVFLIFRPLNNKYCPCQITKDVYINLISSDLPERGTRVVRMNSTVSTLHSGLNNL